MGKDPLKVTQRAVPRFAGTCGQAEGNGHSLNICFMPMTRTTLGNLSLRLFGAGTVLPVLQQTGAPRGRVVRLHQTTGEGQAWDVI